MRFYRKKILKTSIIVCYNYASNICPVRIPASAWQAATSQCTVSIADNVNNVMMHVFIAVIVVCSPCNYVRRSNC